MGISLPLWPILTAMTAYAASTRGRSGPRWFAIGLFFPGVALLALWLMPRLAKTGVDALVHEDLRPCPAWPGHQGQRLTMQTLRSRRGAYRLEGSQRLGGAHQPANR